jgi:hypothetical protein
MLRSLPLTHAPTDGVARATHKGMASWAIPNSPNHCAGCVFWNHLGAPIRKLTGGFGTPAPRRCSQFTTLTNKRGAAVPHNARACRFFEKSA